MQTVIPNLEVMKECLERQANLRTKMVKYDTCKKSGRQFKIIGVYQTGGKGQEIE
jgi:hypothetical protein